MLISGTVELGTKGLKEIPSGFVIRGLEGQKNFLPSLGIFLNPFQSPGYLALCVPGYLTGIL